MYDIFFVSTNNEEDFLKFKKTYPRAQLIENFESFESIRKKSFTKMFWIIWNDLDFNLNFDLNSYRASKWDDMYVHIFKNGQYFDGICLFPKNIKLSSREWDTRFFTDKKEIDICASLPKKFDIFRINNYQEYLDACESSGTPMFWIIWPDLKIEDDFDFSFYVPKHDQKIPHVFKNGENYDGISLMPKFHKVSRKEIDHRYYIEKKEINILASYPNRYKKFILRSYEEYKKILEDSADMFWGQWPNTAVTDNSVFDIYFHHQNSYDRNENHVFLNKCNDVISYRSGLILFSKNKPISKKEFDQQYLIDKKEHDRLVTESRYPVYKIENYDQYVDLIKKEYDMFWCVWPNIDIIDESYLNLYFDQFDGRYDYDRNENHVFKNLCNTVESYLNGLILCSKHKPISKKEFDRKYLIDKKEHDQVITRFRYPKLTLTDYDSYISFIERTESELFWGIWPNVDIIDESIFDFYYDPNNGKYDHDRTENHVFLNSCDTITSYLNGIILFSKNKPISKKEFDRKYLIDKKEHDRVVSRFRYPKLTLTDYDSYVSFIKNNRGDLFWGIWPNVDVIDESIFDFYYDPNDGKYDHDRKENHVFLNACDTTTSYLNGIVLLSSHKPISKKEFDRKYLIDKKEHDRVVSRYRYAKIVLNDYESYTSFLNTTKEDLFWGVWPNVDVIDESIFDFYYDPNDGKYDHDRKENHVFLNACNTESSYLNGLILCSKHKPISKKEFDRKYLIDKKEHDRVVTRFRYSKLTLTDYDSYMSFLNTTKEDLFWGIWPNVDVIDESIFDFYYDPNDGKYDHDRKENHVFLNACNTETSYLNGIVLLSSHKPISKKEFDRKYLIDKKEHDRVVSRFRYPVYKIDSYNDYQSVMASTNSDLFWCIWPEVEIIQSSIFDFYYDPKDGKFDFDRQINHVYQHSFRNTLNYNGIMLMSKHAPVSKKEIDFRYLINKKEHDLVASRHKLYEIVFISYSEPNAEKNWKLLKSKFPHAKRVHGVKGIHQAHIKAASLVNTDMFWVVDGDAILEDEFDFSHVCSRYERNVVHVWRCKNPVNDLIYGYGGVKLLPTYLTLNMNTETSDMTTSISDQFKVMSEVSNITEFNTDPFNTWKSAFRECVKLSSRSILGQDEEETKQRLDIWCTKGSDKTYGEYAIRGAIAGKEFGSKHKNNPEMLSKINDFEWLKTYYGI